MRWLFLLISLPLFANPVGPSVQHGSATFQQDGSHLIIKNSDKAIIHWQKFGIGPGEITEFIQAHGMSAVLNRVIGFEKSLLEGLLKSNGQVFLINPAGVVIGKTGVIETAGFLASTLDLPNQDFLNGHTLHFQGSSKNVILNQGMVKALGKDVTFIAVQVQNEGKVEAKEGAFHVGVGFDVYFQPSEREPIYVKSTENIQVAETGYINTGVVEAIHHNIAADGNLYAKAINLKGEVHSLVKEGQKGRILAVSENGSIIVSDGHITGDVCFLANSIEFEKAHIDAGEDGCIQIGKEGILSSQRGESLAKRIIVDEESSLKVRGEEKEGQILLFAEDELSLKGQFSFEEGVLELSSSQVPFFAGKFDESIPNQKVIVSSKNMRIDQHLIDTILPFADLMLKNSEPLGKMELITPLSGMEYPHILTLNSEGSIMLQKPVKLYALKVEAKKAIHIGDDLTTLEKCSFFSPIISVNPDYDPTIESKRNSIEVESNLFSISSRGSRWIADKDILVEPNGPGSRVDFQVEEGGKIELFSDYGKIMIGKRDPFERIIMHAQEGEISLTAHRDIEIFAKEAIHLSAERGKKGIAIRHGELGVFGDICLSAADIQMVSDSAPVALENLTNGNITIKATSFGMETKQSRGCSSILVKKGTLDLTGDILCKGGSYMQTLSPNGHIVHKSGSLLMQTDKEGVSGPCYIQSLGKNAAIHLLGQGDLALNAEGGDVYIQTLFGPLCIDKSGDISLRGIEAKAHITAKDNTVQVKTPKNLLLKSSEGSNYILGATGGHFVASKLEILGGYGRFEETDAYLMTMYDNAKLTLVVDELTLQGGRGLLSSAYVKTLGHGSDIDIVSQHIYGLGGKGKEAAAEIVTEGKSNISIKANKGIYLKGGSGDLSYSALETFGGGNLFIEAEEGVKLLGGNGSNSSSAYISTTGLTKITTLGALEIKGGDGKGGCNAFVQTTEMNNPLDIKANKVCLQGGTGFAASTYIKTEDLSSPIYIAAGVNIVGGSGEEAFAEIVSESGSHIVIEAIKEGQQISVVSGSGKGAKAGICNKELVGNVSLKTNGRFYVGDQGRVEGAFSEISAAKELTVISSLDDIVIDNQNSESVFSAGSSMLLHAEKGDVCIRGDSGLKLAASKKGQLTIKAGKSIYLQNKGSIETQGAPVYLVTDQLYEGALEFGNGGFYSDRGTHIHSGKGEIRIYVPSFDHQHILGLLNGQSFQGKKGRHDAQSREFALFPSGGYSGPWTIYYKYTPLKMDKAFVQIGEYSSSFFFQVGGFPATHSIWAMREQDQLIEDDVAVE